MSTLPIGPSVAHPQPGSRLETATVEINGGLHDVARVSGETMWRGELHGEDAESGERWAMPFWIPDAAVRMWRWQR